ncbi:MAG: T9SS type A sorting domain-containing protein, partial [Saprospiraceae bacterium]|nr:T9SS type A sorting domain-containing protein [Saprospiraceae bacterium]
AIRKSGQGTGFPVDAFGQPITNVTFTCDELGTQPVELWAQDLAGNAAYCETYVIIQDPFNNCNNPSGPNATVSGATKVNFNDPNMGVEDVNIGLSGVAPNGLPPVSTFMMTSGTGLYNFNAIPVAGNYSVTPLKDDNPMNGVSTFDLVLMSKHILGIEPLNSPYKIIAADINKNNSVTTFDIVELRKLILGIYTELPNNTSWRFVQKSFTFSNQSNPFADTWPEMYQISDLQSNGFNAGDFVSVKIGDLNGSVVPNSFATADDRSNGTVFFDLQDRELRAGEIVEIPVKAADKTAGYQFTLNLKGLEAAGILPGANMTTDNFAIFSDAITASVDGNAGEFTLKLRATQAGKLSEMLSVGSRITRAEAYNENGERYDVALRFNGANGALVSGAGFELLQNTPNPVSQNTNITFNLPEAGEATLTITNAEGRVIKTVQNTFQKGLNTVTFNRAELEAGILFYQLSTSNNSAVKKMIVVD